MKVLLINKFFYPQGGTEAYFFALRNLLQQSGHQVIDFSMQSPDNLPSDYQQYFIKNIDFNKREGLWRDLKKAAHLLYSCEAKKQLTALIKATKPDIAHVHNFSFQLTPSILATLKKHHIPVVWTLHDYKLICPNYRLFTQGQVCQRCKVHKYYNCWKYKCLKNNSAFSFLAMVEAYLHNWLLQSYHQVTAYISPSKFLQQTVTQWGIASEQTQQIYNFINLANFQPEFKSGEGVLYFGRLAEEKGIFDLLEAAKGLPEIKFQIIGAGPLKEAIAQFIQQNKLANIEFLGFKTGTALYQLISNSRLVVVPSIWQENNPISILESFALGKPVIGTNLGGIPELVVDQQTGFLYTAQQPEQLKNIIANNYQNLDKLQKMAHNCRLWVEQNCQPQQHLQQLEHIYHKLISKQKE